MTSPRFVGGDGGADRRITGALLILGFVLLFGGIIMFSASVGRPVAPMYLQLERSFVISAVVLAALGFVLLEDVLQQAGDRVLSRLGATAFLFGMVLIVVAEAHGLGNPTVDDPFELILHRIYVALASASEAVFGASILRTKIVSGWVGWTTILWNVGVLIGLPVFNVLTGDPGYYYPVLQFVMPLVIGIALLSRPPPGAIPE